jgi:hypothetical protein
LLLRSRPRGRLPGLTGIAPFRRAASALAAFLFSALPRLSRDNHRALRAVSQGVNSQLSLNGLRWAALDGA